MYARLHPPAHSSACRCCFVPSRTQEKGCGGRCVRVVLPCLRSRHFHCTRFPCHAPPAGFIIFLAVSLLIKLGERGRAEPPREATAFDTNFLNFFNGSWAAASCRTGSEGALLATSFSAVLAPPPLPVPGVAIIGLMLSSQLSVFPVSGVACCSSERGKWVHREVQAVGDCSLRHGPFPMRLLLSRCTPKCGTRAMLHSRRLFL